MRSSPAAIKNRAALPPVSGHRASLAIGRSSAWPKIETQRLELERQEEALIAKATADGADRKGAPAAYRSGVTLRSSWTLKRGALARI